MRVINSTQQYQSVYVLNVWLKNLYVLEKIQQISAKELF